MTQQRLLTLNLSPTSFGGAIHTAPLICDLRHHSWFPRGHIA